MFELRPFAPLVLLVCLFVTGCGGASSSSSDAPAVVTPAPANPAPANPPAEDPPEDPPGDTPVIEPAPAPAPPAPPPTIEFDAADGCMGCHNGSNLADYGGGGIENPHPFGGPDSAYISCTICHGGNGQGENEDDSHVPPPPEIGGPFRQRNDPVAYFNRLTLTGLDKIDDYEVDGVTYTALDYLQFVNPGDLRVVNALRSCGLCHSPNAINTPEGQHTQWVARSPLGTETGIFSGAMYAAGIDNAVPANAGLHEDTAADLSFRAVANPDFDPDEAATGEVGELIEYPVFSVFGENGANDIFNNDLYDSDDLPDNLDAENRAQANSPLANLFHEQVAFTCGDCHLGSAGANNRYGDFRSSGCTACHMPYSLDGRAGSSDPNIDRDEPENPDAIEAPERPHVRSHVIRSTAKTLSDGSTMPGIDDYACAGCHQGSNRTVMQYWGIRLDQNANLVNGVQYPANPDTFQNTAQDVRLFDPEVENLTFNGRNPDQYILFEDYDGDGRDDTPPDVHYEAGLGCIDCHGGRDLHGGTTGDPSSNKIVSRMEQNVAVSCETCHGSTAGYAATAACVTYDGTNAQCAIDTQGNPLRHVTKGPDNRFYLVSRLTGRRHFVPQTLDVIVDSGVTDPDTNVPVYNEIASYAMGRADGNANTGIGPQQDDLSAVSAGFSHTDTMSCVSCHASWTNNCIGCHLAGEYDDNPDNFFFSNITGDRIVYKEANADFVYQSPVPFQLGVNAHNEIAPVAANTTAFYRYTDQDGNESDVFAFSDRNANGNNPGTDGRNAFGALSHNAMMPHSIRGRVRAEDEGPRYCVACHLTDQALADFGDDYDDFRAAIAANDFDSLDFDQLAEHIGQNPGNQLNSPFWVHMVSGLGTGLFLMDEDGCPVNPIDNDANRQYCQNGAPADNFDTDDVVYNLDKLIQGDGVANSSSSHPLLDPDSGDNLRDGALNENLAGPFGAFLATKLSDPVNGVVLDSWIDADGQPEGQATDFVDPAKIPVAFQVRVSNGNDDAEEDTSDGDMRLNSSDLELTVDNVPQLVGMRFRNVHIPQGATILRAHLQFKVDEATTGTTALTLAGQATDDADGFSNDNGNISERSRTTFSVNWEPQPWPIVGVVGPDQRTPDLSGILQEIVNRGGWSDGNDMVIIVTGFGRRTAESFNGDPDGAPLLVVDYLQP